MKRLTMLMAVAAAALVGMAGAPALESSASIGGAAIFTATVTKTIEGEGRIVRLKALRDRHGTIVGWADTVCISLTNNSAQCVGTFVLPLGKVSVAGTRHNQDFYVFAITGGTGVYAAAGGTLVANTYRWYPQRSERLIFNFTN